MPTGGIQGSKRLSKRQDPLGVALEDAQTSYFGLSGVRGFKGHRAIRTFPDGLPPRPGPRKAQAQITAVSAHVRYV